MRTLAGGPAAFKQLHSTINKHYRIENKQEKATRLSLKAIEY